uniref:Uncharacterized protein n=1 Tax=Astyanax mexicanus TaxID=7994 RepID=A0A3B1IY06_ASTMX
MIFYIVNLKLNKIKVWDFIFQQDLAPAHAAKSTKHWFTKKQLEVLWHAGQLRLTSMSLKTFGPSSSGKFATESLLRWTN